MKRVTNKMVADWFGSNSSREDAIEILTNLANGEYSAVTMREEVEGYYAENDDMREENNDGIIEFPDIRKGK